jgi:hypothetical protein
MTGSPTRFAVLFTLGNFIALAGTTFLSGPKSQFKAMTDKTRLFSKIILKISLNCLCDQHGYDPGFGFCHQECRTHTYFLGHSDC